MTCLLNDINTMQQKQCDIYGEEAIEISAN